MSYMIRKTPNLLPAIAGIALMTITACASATSTYTKATQDAAVAAALKTAADEAQKAQDAAITAARCATPVCDNVVTPADLDTADIPVYPTAPLDISIFLNIIGAEIDTTNVTKADGTTPPDIFGATRAGDDMDGFRYFSGQFEGGETRYFAGILPTTNLGLPLSAQPTTAVWPGFYSLGDAQNRPIDFTINYGDKDIIARDERPRDSIRFDLTFTKLGDINGIVSEHAEGLGAERTRLSRVAGLIGQEGLVGIFTENSLLPIGGGMHGGFVANNPDTNP